MIPNDPYVDTEATRLLGALKEILRDRRIGYQSIADHLDVSLPTVKRMLNKPGLPLDRLLALCRIAEIEPVEVFALANKNLPAHTMFTAEQDELFFRQPEFLSYFQQLLEPDMTPQLIAEQNDLTSRSTQRYLAGLEKVGLIERGVGDTVRLLISPPIGFAPDSKVLRTSHAEFLQHTVQQVLSPEREDHVFAVLKPMQLTLAAYREMIGELVSIIDKYAYLSEHTGNRHLPDLEKWNLAIACGPDYPERSAPIVNL